MNSRRLVSPPALLVFLAGCAGPAGTESIGQTSQASTVCPAGTVVQGVDVSVYQGSISWTDVKAAGVDFAIARISDGTDLDSEFASNWSGMNSAGLVRGAYQYFEPGEDPTSQATIVVNAVGKLGAGDLPVTADMEATGTPAATVVANLATWAAAVKAGTGKAPMVYTAEGYWDSDVDSTSFGGDSLWVANWEVSCPSLPDGWSNWSIWQYSDSGNVNGISGSVDQDEYNGTLADLQAFAGGSGATMTSDSGTAPAGTYGATYVSQSWPLATSALSMTTCQTMQASITLKNSGTIAWDSHTRLATTEPENRASVFADSTWIAADRPAEVTGTVAPGDTFEFKFDFHAPPTTGMYAEHFGMVQDGVVWFSAAGQGGPADSDIEANIDVTAGSTACTADPGVPDAGVVSQDGGTIVTADAGGASSGPVDAAVTGTAVEDAGAHPGTSGSDAGATATGDAGAAMHAGGSLPDAGTAEGSSPDGGASAGSTGGCSTTGRSAGGDAMAWALGLLAVVTRRRLRPRASRARRPRLPTPPQPLAPARTDD